MPASPRKLRLEQLEDRSMMTAVVSQVGDTAFITGTDNPLDNFDQNELVVVRQKQADRFKVVFDVAGAPVIVDGVNRIVVDLGDGVDQLVLRGQELETGLAGGVSIDMGAGPDGIRAKGFDVDGLVEILADVDEDGELSTDPEVITIQNCYWVGGTRIATGDGVDQIRIFGGARLRAFADISTGDGNDFVFLADSVFGHTSVDMGEGDDDRLQVLDNLFNGFASFEADGDEDNDAAEIDGNTFRAGVSVDGFETVI